MVALHLPLVGLLLRGVCGVAGTSAMVETHSLDVIMPMHETLVPDRSFPCFLSHGPPLDH